MARVYATEAEYKDYDKSDENESDVIVKRLRDASHEVEGLTRTAVYATDVDGMPTDPVIREAFRDATMAIVSYWGETDDPNGADIAAGAVKIGSVSLGTTSASQENLTDLQRLTRRIGELAVTILRNAGLMGSAIAHT
ncbi:hypothetical protein [Microbacterium sp. GXS0129]|uniref:hypothetical protein n=1 Tax=Microbacterium sp. GXS0129 TaxID=3377836 RepID=UPI00383A97AC